MSSEIDLDALRAEFSALVSKHTFPRSATESERDQLASEFVASSIYEGGNIADAVQNSEQIVKAPQGLQHVIDKLVPRVLQDFELLGSPITPSVIVREFPTGEFNARVNRAKNGFIVLMNSGLMMLLYQVAKIMALSLNFSRYHIESGEPIEGSEFGQPGWNPSQCTGALADVLTEYVEFSDSTRAPRQSMLGGERLRFLDRVIEVSEKFVLAHEFAHIVCGHFRKSDYTHILTPRGAIDVIDESASEEMEADIVGLRAILQRVNWNTPTLTEARFQIGGPVYVFGVEMLVESARAALGKFVTSTSHPLPAQRIANLQQFVNRHYGEDLYSVAYQWKNWTTAYCAPVAQEICRRRQKSLS